MHEQMAWVRRKKVLFCFLLFRFRADPAVCSSLPSATGTRPPRHQRPLHGDCGVERQTALIGTPAMIRQRLAAYGEAKVQEIIVRFVDATQLESVRLLTIKLLISGKCRTIGYERHRMF